MGENWPRFPRDEIYSAMEPAPCLSSSFIGCWCWPSERTSCLRLFLRGEQKGVVFGLRLLQTIVPSHKILSRGKPGNPPWKIPWTSFNHHTYSTGHDCPKAALYYTMILCSVDLYQLFICSSIDVFSNIQMRLCFFKAPLKIIQSPESSETGRRYCTKQSLTFVLYSVTGVPPALHNI